jgi:hypothetical protein
VSCFFVIFHGVNALVGLVVYFYVITQSDLQASKLYVSIKVI